VDRSSAVLRWVATCIVAVSLIAEWPLALALSSRHLAGTPALGGVFTASLCLSGNGSGHDAADRVPGGPAHGPGKSAPCPVCQGLHALKAPLPAGPAEIRRDLAAARATLPEPAPPVTTARLESKQPRGPPLA